MFLFIGLFNWKGCKHNLKWRFKSKWLDFIEILKLQFEFLIASHLWNNLHITSNNYLRSGIFS